LTGTHDLDSQEYDECHGWLEKISEKELLKLARKHNIDVGHYTMPIEIENDAPDSNQS